MVLEKGQGHIAGLGLDDPQVGLLITVAAKWRSPVSSSTTSTFRRIAYPISVSLHMALTKQQDRSPRGYPPLHWVKNGGLASLRHKHPADTHVPDAGRISARGSPDPWSRLMLHPLIASKPCPGGDGFITHCRLGGG